MKIIIVNDPTRKNDDITYLKEKLYSFTFNKQYSVISFNGYDDVAKKLCNNVTVLDPQYNLINPNEIDFAFIMSNGLLEGFTGAVLRKFDKYHTGYTF